MQHMQQARTLRRARNGVLVILATGVVAVLVLFIEATIARRAPRIPDPDFQLEGRAVQPSRDARGAAGSGVRGTVSMAMIGDSLVRGVGIDEAEDSLPMQVAQRVADETGVTVLVSSYGVSGEQAAEIDRRLDDIDDGSSAPDILVIVAGSNDVTGMTPPGTLARHTDELLSSARRRFPDTKLFLAGIPRFSEATAMAQPLRGVADRYSRVLQRRQAEVAARHDDVGYVDIARRASPRFEGHPEGFSPDAYHPSKVGYGYWADAIAEDVAGAADAAAAAASAASIAGTISRS